MYQLYTQPRPGHPRWALVASALLLLTSLVMAQALIQIKTREHWVSLQPVQVFPHGHLQAALPVGWQTRSEDLLPGVVVDLSEETDRRPRQLLIMRTRPQPYGLPSRQARLGATEAVNLFMPGVRPLKDAGPAQIGPLPGWTVYGESLSPFDGGRVASCLARTAIGPGGQMVSVVLRVPDRIQRADRQLVEQISSHTLLLDVQPVSDVARAMEATGIRFRPPAGARFVHREDLDAPVLRMIGGQGRGAWFLNVHAVPLMESRTPRDLVVDHALSALRQADLDHSVETSTVNGRDLVSLGVSPSGEADPWVQIWSVAMSDEHALLLVGRHDEEAGPALLAVCRAVAADARLDDASETRLDLAAAIERSLDLLGDVQAGSWAEASVPRSGDYRLASPATAWGLHEGRQELREADDGALYWHITNRIRPDPATPRQEWRENWWIRIDGQEHQYTFDQTVSRRTEMRYLERREAGSDRVSRELRVVGGQRTTSTPIGPLYAPEPLLLYLAGQIANDPEARPAVFEATDAFCQGSHYWLITPIGEDILPGGEDGTAPAVRLQRDFEPAPILLYYDHAGHLLAIAFDSGSWRELVAPEG